MASYFLKQWAWRNDVVHAANQESSPATRLLLNLGGLVFLLV